MHRPIRAVLTALVMVASLLAAGASQSVANPDESFIVVLQPGTEDVPGVAQGLARAHGGEVGFVYETALQGFQVTLPANAAAAIARNPAVAYVEPDVEITLDAQTTPTGIQRIFADDNPDIGIGGDGGAVDVDVAVIDTGIDLDHVDLDVMPGVTCLATIWDILFGNPITCDPGGNDDHYHGTHVAGTIGALDNGLGVVGVAPGARLWPVKVLDSQGSGYTSGIVAGIDWVAARGDIEVANMSLGGAGFQQAMYDAIDGAVAAGVAFAVAAGNDDDDANGYSPGGFDNVLSTSALADFDGAPGGGAASTCRSDQDDTLADFSNWGPEVDIAAPGVCIVSTYPNDSYGTISGTSMASPHAAGALALLASSQPGASPYSLYAQVVAAGNLDWTDDSGDGIQEPLLDVSGFVPTLVGGEPPPPPVDVPPVASFTYDCANHQCTFDSSGSHDPDGGALVSHSWDFGDGETSTEASPTHVFPGDGTYTVALTVVDDEADDASTSQDVTLSTAPTGGPVASFFVVGCDGLTCTVDGSASTGDLGSHLWDWGDGSADTVGTYFPGIESHTYGAPGTYTVELLVMDFSFQADATTHPVSPGTNDPPSASFTFSCTDLECAFTDTSTDGDGTIVGWAWDFGGDGASSAEDPNHTFGSAGTYGVSLVVTDDDGATDEYQTDVTVSEPPPPAAITLSLFAYKERGRQYADLTWSGAAGPTVDILRDGAVVATTANDGAFTDMTRNRGGGTADYQVCEAGTSTCSPVVSATW